MNRPNRNDVRQRNLSTSNKSSSSTTTSHRKIEEGKYVEKEIKFPIPASLLIFVLILAVTVFVAVIVIEKKLPPGIKVKDEWKHTNRFIAERAKNFLVNLTNLGPRVAGSKTNEVFAVNLLVNEISDIMSRTKNIHKIEMDIQKASGSYSLSFLDGLTVVYNNMQNVIVKVGSKKPSPYSLLLNCHFDTVTDSPGASDDGAGCAVMLEVLKVIARSDRRLKHNIIFLFNGAEENFMPASHGFITQHKWAKEVQVFINLEACGAGGREVLFQAGPNHPWIMEIYSNVVPYPYASSLAQEIFQSGIVPGDTDYRIFRDFGHISGLDFAWSTNGYVYHTKFDSIDYVPLGTLQRTGDNILALVKGIANAHQLSNVTKFRSGNLVFFDFLGAFVVRWSEFISNFINVSMVWFSLFILKSNKENSADKSKYVKKVLQSLLGMIASWVILVIVVIVIAGILNVLGRTMSWFARPVWIFFLYIVPTMLIPMIFIRYYSNPLRKDLKSPWKTFELYFDGLQLLWTVILLVCVIFRIRSGFIPLIWVIYSSFTNLLQRNCQFKDWRYLVLHVGMMSLPFIQSFYLMLGALYLFIPIMGRSGAGNNSEIIIAVMVALLFSFLLSFVIPLVLLITDPGKVFTMLTGVFLMSIGMLLLTPFGFPYSGDPQSPAPQRFIIANTRRTIHLESGETIRNTGYWVVDLDINSPFTVNHIVPEMENAKLVLEDCQKYLYCGQPYLVPVQSFIWKTHWLEGPEPYIWKEVEMKVVERIRKGDTEQIVFNITGPDHMGVMISPVNGVTLQKWNINDDTPLADVQTWQQGTVKRKTYFIYYCYAGDDTPLNLTLTLKVPESHTGPVIDIAVTSHLMYGKKASDEFQAFVNKFPVWTAVTSWSATYESWVI